MLTMQSQMSDVGPSSVHVPDLPPVGEVGQKGPGIFVEAMVEVIFQEVAHDDNDQGYRPVTGNDGYD